MSRPHPRRQGYRSPSIFHGVEAGPTFGAVYYPIVTLYQLFLAGLVLRAGRVTGVRAGVALVLGVNALEAYAFWAWPRGFPTITPGVPLFYLDALLVLTLPYLASQIPGPLGGARGARVALAAWLGALGAWIALWAAFDASSAVHAWARVAVNPGCILLAGALLAAHAVPASLRLAPGPLRVQSLTLAAGLGVGLSATSGAAGGPAALAIPVWDPPAAYEWAAQAGFVLLLFPPLLLVVVAARAGRSRGDARALAALVALGLAVGLVDGLSSRLQLNEIVHQSVRPLLVAVALLRYGFVEVPLALRRPLAVATAALGVASLFLLLAITFAGGDILASESVGPVPVLAAALVLAVVAYAGRGHVEDFLTLARGGDAVEDAARLERYRLALEARREAGASAPDDAELARLRRELGVTAAQHQALEAVLARNVVIPSAALLGAQPGMIVGGRFAVERLLGQGGQGRALLARDVKTGRLVVLKEALRPWEADAAARRAALRREAATAARATSPHLARVEGVVEEAWQTYLVREYVPGDTLEERVERAGPLGPAEAAEVARGVLAGLEALHRVGLACLDVKPANVVLAEPFGVGGPSGPPEPKGRPAEPFGVGGPSGPPEPKGRPRKNRAVLIDQGTARAAGPSADASATLARGGGADPFTARWAAPEQLRGGAVDFRTDVYQAGALVAFALTGEAPEPGRRVPPGVPGEWRSALERALAREKDERFADAAAFREALDAGGVLA